MSLSTGQERPETTGDDLEPRPSAQQASMHRLRAPRPAS
jgi:hypothetical protein